MPYALLFLRQFLFLFWLLARRVWFRTLLLSLHRHWIFYVFRWVIVGSNCLPTGFRLFGTRNPFLAFVFCVESAQNRPNLRFLFVAWCFLYFGHLGVSPSDFAVYVDRRLHLHYVGHMAVYIKRGRSVNMSYHSR